MGSFFQQSIRFRECDITITLPNSQGVERAKFRPRSRDGINVVARKIPRASKTRSKEHTKGRYMETLRITKHIKHCGQSTSQPGTTFCLYSSQALLKLKNIRNSLFSNSLLSLRRRAFSKSERQLMLFGVLAQLPWIVLQDPSLVALLICASVQLVAALVLAKSVCLLLIYTPSHTLRQHPLVETNLDGEQPGIIGIDAGKGHMSTRVMSIRGV